MQIILNFIF